MLKLCNLHQCCLLLRAAQKYHPPGQLPGGFGEAPSVATVIKQLIAAKTAGNLRSVYLKSLEYYLNRFASGREQKPLADFTTAEVEAWLNQFDSAGSRQTWLNRISGLFGFAVRREIIAKNPCTKIERIRVDCLPPSIFSPEQVDLMLATVPENCRAYLVLGMFAGIRPDEILGIDWSEIDLATKTVRVNKTKTRLRRIVPLHPRATALLSACRVQAGPVSPGNQTIRRFKRDARIRLGLSAWPKDVLRHTAASYLLALHGDVGRVAMMLGNSPNILLTHYHEPVNASNCALFWKTA